MISQGNWSLGKLGGVVVTDSGEGFPVNSGHGENDYYGGYLIAESILKKGDAQAIAAVPEMESALRSFIVGMEGPEQFPGHNQIYLQQVVLPRAKEALTKAGIKW
jgi:hypothetical protein